MAGPDLVLRKMFLPLNLDVLVGDAALLARELLPPSLTDLWMRAELYRNGTGNGGGLALSTDALVDAELVVR